MGESKKVNLFIIGAPKCGTTSLVNYFKKVDHIFVPTIKEPHYFANDFYSSDFPPVKRIEDYISLYSGSSSEKYRCDASVFYLYSNNAIKNIYNYNSDAKIIVMLRNPVDMVYSLHSQLLHTFNENIKSFSRAWQNTVNRKAGKKIPLKNQNQRWLYYDEVAKFGSQIENVLNYFSKNQIHFIILEKFKIDPLNEFNRVLEFLDLDKIDEFDFKVHNANKVYIFRRLIRFIRRPSNFSLKIGRRIKKVFGISEKYGVRDRIRKVFEVKKERKEMPDAIGKTIYKHYLNEINKLEKLIAMDLKVWKDKYARL